MRKGYREQMVAAGLSLLMIMSSVTAMPINAYAASKSQVISAADSKDIEKGEMLPARLSGFKYVHDPMENSKAAEDIIVDPDAIYGYSPNPASQRLGSFASYDFSDPVLVEETRNKRIAYHKQDAKLYQILAACEANGESTETAARQISHMRNVLRLKSYDGDPEGLKKVKESNLKTYGNEEGPTADSLYEKYGSWEKVIEKAMSSNPGMDACLGLYDDYYITYVANGQVPGITDADKLKIDTWGENRPDDLTYLQYKAVYDNPLFYDQQTGEVHYPANDGFWGEGFDYVLTSKMKIERYGSDNGFYVGFVNTEPGKYSPEPGSEYEPYSVFEVVKTINVKCGAIFPWFNEEGGGTRIVLPMPIKDLEAGGYIVRVS